MFNPFIWYLDYLNDCRVYYRAVQELNRLTDHELCDIGLTRNDIPFAALDSWKNTRTGLLLHC